MKERYDKEKDKKGRSARGRVPCLITEMLKKTVLCLYNTAAVLASNNPRPYSTVMQDLRRSKQISDGNLSPALRDQTVEYLPHVLQVYFAIIPYSSDVRFRPHRTTAM